MINIEIKPADLTFGVTNQCTAACPNCSGSFNQNPEQLHFLTAQQMCARIDEAFALGWTLPHGICFTGGEALIRKSDILIAAKYARSKGIDSISIMSNGSWAKHPVQAGQTARELKNAGVTEVYFSTGVDHQKFVDEQTILNSIKACQEVGIYCELDVESEVDDSTIKRLIANPKLKKVEIDELNWIAWKTRELRTSEKMKRIDPFTGCGCDMLWKTCYVNSENKVQACCGQFNNLMPQMLLGEALSNWCERTPMHVWLSVDGPRILYSFSNPDIYPFHGCQVCFAVQNLPNFHAAAEEAWPAHKESVMHRFNFIKSLFIANQKAKNENH